MMNNHFQDVEERFPEQMARARTHYRVEKLTHRKLLSYFGAVKVPQCCRLSFPRSQVSWEEDGVLYVDICNRNYKALIPDVAQEMHFNTETTGDLIEALLGWVYLRARHNVAEVMGTLVSDIVEMIERGGFALWLLSWQ